MSESQPRREELVNLVLPYAVLAFRVSMDYGLVMLFKF